MAKREASKRDTATLSIIVGSRGHGAESSCLRSLADQVGAGVEVILVEAAGSEERVPEWVSRVSLPGALVPELWAEGLRHASGEVVALIAATVAPDGGWVRRVREQHAAGKVAIGGPIEPGPHMGYVGWAVYFCRYAPFMLPLVHMRVEIPGDNASYRADVLGQYSQLYEDGFWEPFVHRALRLDGHELIMDSERVVRHVGTGSAASFCRQRFQHGRANGEKRSSGLTSGRILLAALSAPLVPFVMTMRVAREVTAKRRHRLRFLASAPLVFLFHTWWAAGEFGGRVCAARGRGRA